MSYDRKTEPTQITQGERFVWTRTFCDYPASEFTLQYRFRGEGTGFNVTATADGDDFDAVITSTQSAACSIKRYRWQAWATEIADATNINMIAEGVTDVLRGFASGTTTTVDLRSDNQIALDTINAAISGQTTANIQEYEISTSAGSRKIKRMSMSDLLAAREVYSKLVAEEKRRERVRNGRPYLTQIKMRVYDE